MLLQVGSACPALVASLPLAMQSPVQTTGQSVKGDECLPGLLWIIAGHRSWGFRSLHFLPETIDQVHNRSKKTWLGLTVLEQGGDLPSCSMRMQIKPAGAKSRIYWCREWKCPANSFRHRGSNHNFRTLSLHFLATFQPHGGQDSCCPSGSRILISGRGGT